MGSRPSVIRIRLETTSGQPIGQGSCDSVVVLEIHHVDGQQDMSGGRTGVTIIEHCGPANRMLTPEELFTAWTGLTAVLRQVSGMPAVYQRVLGQAGDSVNSVLAVGRSMGGVDGEIEVTDDTKRVRGG